MSSLPRGAIRSTRTVNAIDNSDYNGGSMLYGLIPSVGGGSPWRHLFRGVVDPKNSNLRCCGKDKLDDTTTFSKVSGYRRGSYATMNYTIRG